MHLVSVCGARDKADDFGADVIVVLSNLSLVNVRRKLTIGWYQYIVMSTWM